MRYAFVVSSMEPGKDGVGDYTRRLAGMLIKTGCDVTVLALRDCNLSASYHQSSGWVKEVQDAEGCPLVVHRCSPLLSWYRRVELAKEYLEAWSPQWISVQLVPFGFHSRGLLHKAVKPLATIARHRNCKTHLMVHELWSGAKRTNIIRFLTTSLFSCIQKRGVKLLIKRLQADVIHTQLPAYQELLRAVGVEALPLPLFSNLPVLARQQNHLSHESEASTVVRDEEAFIIGAFSQIEIKPALAGFLLKLHEESIGAGRQIKVKLLGGRQNGRARVLEQWNEHLQGRIPVVDLGRLEIARTTRELASFDLGITPVPRHALGKSGTVAAFLSNHCPVAAPCVDPASGDIELAFFDPKFRYAIVREPTMNAVYDARRGAEYVAEEITPARIARRFINDLDRA